MCLFPVKNNNNNNNPDIQFKIFWSPLYVNIHLVQKYFVRSTQGTFGHCFTNSFPENELAYNTFGWIYQAGGPSCHKIHYVCPIWYFGHYKVQRGAWGISRIWELDLKEEDVWKETVSWSSLKEESWIWSLSPKQNICILCWQHKFINLIGSVSFHILPVTYFLRFVLMFFCFYFWRIVCNMDVD